MTFDDLQPGTYRLGATSPSHQPVDADTSTSAIDAVSVVVGPGAHVTQQVQMVAHARIVGRVRAQEGTGTIDLDQALTVTATFSPATGNSRSWSGSDPAGAGGYSITGSADTSQPGLPNGDLQMAVRLASGAAPCPGTGWTPPRPASPPPAASARCNGGVDRCDLTLIPLPGSIRGRVVNGSGTGINGVTVTATRSDGSVTRTETTVTCPSSLNLPNNNDNGCYGYENDGNNNANTLNDLPHGTYSVAFARTGFKPLELTQITVSRGEINTIATQTLDSSTTTLNVDVVAIYDSQQDSVALTAGASVQLFQNGNGVGTAQTVNSQGRVTFSNLPDGETYQIRATAVGLLPRHLGPVADHHHVRRHGGPHRHAHRAAAHRRRHRRVRPCRTPPAPPGLRVPGVTVDIEGVSTSRPDRERPRHGLERAGRRVSLPPGDYHIDVDGSTAAPAHLNVADADLTVPVTDATTSIANTVTIQESRLTGTITVDDGEGAATTTNVVVALNGAGSNDPSGSFALSSGAATFTMFVRPDTYSVTASVEGSSDHTTATATGIDLDPAGGSESITSTLVRLGDMRVRVHDESGQLVSGATVTLVGTSPLRSGHDLGRADHVQQPRAPQLHRSGPRRPTASRARTTFVVPVGHTVAADGDPDVTVDGRGSRRRPRPRRRRTSTTSTTIATTTSTP